MIRRLALKDWRNYEDLDVTLEPGTTFVVAPNGIGKTSLIEAAGWALFGEAGLRPDGAVRAGATEAIASVHLELPDGRMLSIVRTFPKRASRNLPTPVIHLDGREVDAIQATEAMQVAYAADSVFLARLTMLRGRLDADAPENLGLQEHLCRFFGVDGLQSAVERLDVLLKNSSKLIRAAKQASPVKPQRLAALRAHVAEAGEASDDAGLAYGQATRLLEQALGAERERVAQSLWRSKQDLYVEAVAGVAEQAVAVLGELRSTDALGAAIETGELTLQGELDALRVQQGENSGRRAALDANQESLDGAHGDCPVCRRPLDETTIRVAHETHDAELRRLAVDAEGLRQREAELLAQQAGLRDLRTQLQQIQPPGPPPATPAPLEVALGSIESLTDVVEASLDELVAARATHDAAASALAEALADRQAAEELERLFADDAVLRAAREATASTVTELLGSTIRPLAREIDARWKYLFPGRGLVTTHADGSITREVNGEELPYTAFSTGERMGALVLLRLLVLQTATRANFCWFDEPLEHLDPDVRRQVAGLLSRVSSAGPLKQILVTTYEEPLARRLEERDPEHVHLVYVRARIA